MGELKTKVMRGMFWALMERFGVKGVSLLLTVVLARLLTPSDYGVVALMTIFIAISEVFVDAGFSKAMIQRKEVSQTDMNSVFYVSLVISVVIYGIIFLAAPAVAVFYRMPEISALLRALAVVIVFNSIAAVQNVELERSLRFKLSFGIGMIQVLVSGAIGVGMACFGYGPWALVWSMIAGSVAGCVTRYLVIGWRPTCSFSRSAVVTAWHFGWKVMSASLLTVVYRNLYGLLIGKFYSRADLAYFSKGRQLPSQALEVFDGTLLKVSFPALSKLQEDVDRMRVAMQRMLACSSFILYPIAFGFLVLAKPVILVMFGDQWLTAVPILQVACIGILIRPFDTINLQALLASGRSGLYLKLIIVRRIIAFAVLVATIKLGILTFLLCDLMIACGLSAVLNSIPSARYFGYGLFKQVSDVLIPLVLSVVMAGIVYCLGMLPVRCEYLLPLQIVIGVIMYLFAAVLFRVPQVGECLHALESISSARHGSRFSNMIRRRCSR